MSGSIGADRIRRENVEETVKAFERFVLINFPGYKKYAITGSYNAGTKKDHGDIDLLILVDREEPVAELKILFKERCQWNGWCKHFRSGTNAYKKAQMYGNIVTCEVPIIGQPGESVQVDVTIVRSEQEMIFQKNFLDMDAMKQTLLTAVVRTELCDHNYDWYEDLFDIEAPECKENQEKEFVLSVSGLSYRLVTLDENKKTIKKQELWRSTNWGDVIALVAWIDFDKSYEEMLNAVDDVYRVNQYDSEKDQEISKRVRARILGIMKSMIRIGKGEYGTPKGDAKLNGIKLAEEILDIK